MNRAALVFTGVVVFGIVIGCEGREEKGWPEPAVEIETGVLPQALARTTGGPDLSVDPARLETSAEIVTQNIAERSCAFVEGCVEAPGKRKLLRFDVVTPNLGDQDIHMGPPWESPELYEYSACHRHYHLLNYALYELLDTNGNSVMRGGKAVVGRKQAFCLLDSLKYDPDAGSSHGYTCSNQGITAGWADLYNKELDCQWIDVTDVPNGQYRLRVTINKEGVVPEAHTNNNVATVPVTISDKTGAAGGRPRPPR